MRTIDTLVSGVLLYALVIIFTTPPKASAPQIILLAPVDNSLFSETCADGESSAIQIVLTGLEEN